jgi:hypothetical protein
VAINGESACGAGRFAGKKILRKKIGFIFLPPIFLPWIGAAGTSKGELTSSYPYGHGLLAVEPNSRPGLACKLRRLGLTMHQSGDREKTFLFPLERFPEVAATVRPRRRRVLTEKQHCRLIALGQRHRYVSTPKIPSGPGEVALAG